MVPANAASQESYTGGAYQHDIFVSYSHGRPPKGRSDSDLKLWSHELVANLEEHIGYSLEEKRPINVWFDTELRGNDALTDTLKQRVEKSATLLIVMSGDYLASEWCDREREWFQQASQRRGGSIDNVFVVRAMPTEPEGWPNFLKDDFGETLLGYPFSEEAKGKEARPFGWVKPLKSDSQFYEALTKLVSDIAAKLDEMRKAVDIASAATNETPAGQMAGPILVAPGTEDVRDNIKELRTHLAQQGYRLLPPQELAIESFTESDEKQAASIARAFVQCLGFSAAKEEGADIGRVQLLNQRMHQHAIPQFVWRNHSIPLSLLNYDPAYKQFVESLGELPERTISELGDEVVRYLQQQIDENHSDQPLIAFMEVPAGALNEFDQLKDNIRTDHCVLLPLKPPEPGQLSQIQQERKSRQFVYRACNAVLLMYCMAGQLHWLTDAIVNYEKDITPVRRELERVPVPVVIDSVGEAERVALPMGVDVVPWDGSDPDNLWQRLRSIAT